MVATLGERMGGLARDVATPAGRRKSGRDGLASGEGPAEAYDSGPD